MTMITLGRYDKQTAVRVRDVLQAHLEQGFAKPQITACPAGGEFELCAASSYFDDEEDPERGLLELCASAMIWALGSGVR